MTTTWSFEIVKGSHTDGSLHQGEARKAADQYPTWPLMPKIQSSVRAVKLHDMMGQSTVNNRFATKFQHDGQVWLQWGLFYIWEKPSATYERHLCATPALGPPAFSAKTLSFVLPTQPAEKCPKHSANQGTGNPSNGRCRLLFMPRKMHQILKENVRDLQYLIHLSLVRVSLFEILAGFRLHDVLFQYLTNFSWHKHSRSNYSSLLQ